MGKSAADDGSGAHGYLTSALAFAGITALWAVIVRNDPYYRVTDLFGARVPATMIAYLVLMPLAGFLIGRWRYQAPHKGGVAGYAGKLFARFVHFTYVHLLIVLFTVAMATDYFLGLNIDEQIKTIDDRMFDLAARFAPWLAAYLTGFNLGRAIRGAPPAAHQKNKDHQGFAGAETSTEEKPARRKSRAPSTRTEPIVELPALPASSYADLGDLNLAKEEKAGLTASGLPAWRAEADNDQPGFLPPQDLDKLRPGLHQLR